MILPSDDDSRKPGDSGSSDKPEGEPDVPMPWDAEDEVPGFFGDDEEVSDPYGGSSPVQSPAPPGWRQELKAALVEAVDDLKEIEDPAEDFDPPEPPDLFTFYGELVAMRNELRRGARRSAEALQQLAAKSPAGAVGSPEHAVAMALVYLHDRVAAGAKKALPLVESAMRQAGIERVVTTDAVFDPDIMVTDDTWSAKSKVGSELEAGFVWNSKVLRPARVSLK